MWFRVGCLVVAAGLLLVACGSGGQGAGSGTSGVLRYGAYQFTSLDPRRSNDLDTLFLEPVYDSLIRRTPSGTFESGLATEWSLSADAMQFSMTLREGVTFQDGTPFDAEAVRKNILAAQTPGSVRSAQLALISSVDAVDAQHVRLNLSAPGSALIGVLAGEAGMMISPAALDRDDVVENPVGAGPYTVVQNDQGRVVYRAWDGYWAKDTVKNTGLEFTINSDATTQFRALQSGEIDAQGILASQAEQARSAGLTVLATPTTSLWQLALNVEDPVLADPKVRRAIAHAIDRQAISNNMTAGTCIATVQPYGKGFVGHNDALDDPALGYDEAKARQLVAEAAVPPDAGLVLSVSSSTQQQQMASILQAELKAIGISVEVEVLDQPALSAKRQKGDFDMAVSLKPTARPDPTQYVVDTYVPGGVDNPGGFSLAGIEPLLQAAARSTDDASRGAALGRIAAMVYEAGQPMVPICSTTFHFAYREGVSGLQGPALNDFDWAGVSVQ